MRFLLFALFLFPGSMLFAQRFGGTPPRVKWQQIDTDTARIIFPAGLDSQASRTATLIHYLAANQPMVLGKQLRKIDIVLQNQTTVSNAYVGLGPWRSEFYLTPALNGLEQGTIPWNDQLSLHEYRHVEQFNNFNVGISRVMGVLFGQEGYALAVNASIPDWFYEGDAVYNESVLTGQGRGRVPLFLNAYPSLWRAQKHYSWMKLRNGSLKDYVPSHYHLGYLLVNYGRMKYGPDFWSSVTKDAAGYKGLIYPFQAAIKRHTGLSYRSFYNNAFAYYQKTWDAASPSTVKEQGGQSVFSTNKRVVNNYYFPYTAEDGQLIFLRSAYDQRPAFFRRDASGVHRIRVRDISIDEQFSYRKEKIVYAAYETDKRWGWRDYSVIRILDAYTGRQRTLTHRTKYFTPDISPSGNRIAAVSLSPAGKSEVHILDATNGTMQFALRSSDINVFADPKFISDSTLVCVVRLPDGRSALAHGDLQSGALIRLTDPSYNVIGFPNVQHDTVYFTGSAGGNDDLYGLTLSNGKVYRLVTGGMGKYFVNATGGKLTWSAFTAEGYQLMQADLSAIRWEPVPKAVTDSATPVFPVTFSSEYRHFLENAPVRTFSSSRYPKTKGFFNFHSWRPYYEDPEFSFSLYGENVLNTTQTELYYLYNQNERTHATGVNFIYGGLFPYLSVGSQYTFHRTALGSNNRLKEWNQLDTRAGVSIPLNWTAGRFINNFSAGSNYVYRTDFNTGVNKNVFSTVRFSYLLHTLSWSQRVQQAPQHIFPRLGYSITANYRHAITNYTSWQPLVTGAIYLPGAMKAHSLVLTGAFQETDTATALFSNRFSYSRGYNEAYFARMWRASVNYHFPLWHPDFGLANILYLQLIRANAFFDLTRVYTKDKSQSRDQRAVGGEVYVDTRWWNQYPLTFGFRVSHLLDNDLVNPQGLGAGSNVFEFILPVSIFPR